MLTYYNNDTAAAILVLICLVLLKRLGMEEFTGVHQQIIRLLEYIELIYILSN